MGRDHAPAADSKVPKAQIRDGYRKIRALLMSKGWKVGKNLVGRLYLVEGFALSERLSNEIPKECAASCRPLGTKAGEDAPCV